MVSTTVQSNTTANKGGAPKKARSGKRKVASRARAANGRSRTRRARGASSNRSQGMTAQLYRQGRDMVSGAYETAAKAGRSMPRSIGLRARGKSAYSMLEERPLVMGAVGIGVGMVLGALLPSMTSHRGRR